MKSSLITPARVSAVIAYVVSIAYPGVTPDLRAGIVAAVTGVYVLGVAIVEAMERKHGRPGVLPPPASAPPSSSPTTPEVTDAS